MKDKILKNVGLMTEKNCTGCRACEQLCPVKCIKMTANNEGFLLPQVQEDVCIGCSVCVNNCPQNNKLKLNSIREVLCVKNKDDVSLSKSASGGVFPVLAEFVLENNGLVFGSTYDEEVNVLNIGIDNKDEIEKIQGSKYVQSDTKGTFTEAKIALDSGRMVLYTGTPCQIGGLKAFLRKDYDNLITAEIICHGVPSLKFFKAFLEYLNNKYGRKITGIDFRCKDRGWGNAVYRLFYKKNGKNIKKVVYTDKSSYYDAFLKGNICRKSCYSCLYARGQRIADITMGDFWGAEEFHKNFNSINGASYLSLNTEKGIRYLKAIENKFDYEKSDYKYAIKYNHNLEKPTPISNKRDFIYEEFIKLGNNGYKIFDYDCLKPSVGIKKKITNRLPAKLRNWLKKL